MLLLRAAVLVVAAQPPHMHVGAKGILAAEAEFILDAPMPGATHPTALPPGHMR